MAKLECNESLVACKLFLTISIGVMVSASASEGVSGKDSSEATDVNEIKKEYLDWIARWQNLTTISSTVDADPLELVGTVAASSGRSRTTIVVDLGGRGNFTSVAEAVNSIPNGSKDLTIISVGPGTYSEQVTINNNKGAITLLGSGISKTIVTWNLDATTAGGTSKSATVSVQSDHFVAKDISFQNTSPSPAPGAVGRQAVAFDISGDKAAFYRVGFLGFQDTLYDRYGRHYFKDCHIQGSIDYIFGDGQSFYETCHLNSVATSAGSLTAHKRSSAAEDTGYVFSDCSVRGTGYLYLSRAWGPFSRVVFIRTYFDNIIRPEGWFSWGIPTREKQDSVDLKWYTRNADNGVLVFAFIVLRTVFYGEHDCFGPGANRKRRVDWSYELTDAQVQPFATKERWLGNWISKEK